MQDDRDSIRSEYSADEENLEVDEDNARPTPRNNVRASHQNQNVNSLQKLAVQQNLRKMAHQNSQRKSPRESQKSYKDEESSSGGYNERPIKRFANLDDMDADSGSEYSKKNSMNRKGSKKDDAYSSSQDGEVKPPKQKHLYKTVMCRLFEDTGECKFGDKCHYAHGEAELKPLIKHPKYKTERCKLYHETGICPFGKECSFLHNESEDESSQLRAIAKMEDEKAHSGSNSPRTSSKNTHSPTSSIYSRNAGSAPNAPMNSPVLQSPTNASSQPRKGASNTLMNAFSNSPIGTPLRSPHSSVANTPTSSAPIGDLSLSAAYIASRFESKPATQFGLQHTEQNSFSPEKEIHGILPSPVLNESPRANLSIWGGGPQLETPWTRNLDAPKPQVPKSSSPFDYGWENAPKVSSSLDRPFSVLDAAQDPILVRPQSNENLSEFR
jgi:hypothetical protein